MAISCRLQRVENDNLGLHHYLQEGDECYFLGEYTSRQSYSYSEINGLIYNLKKKPSSQLSNPAAYQYKIQDIGRVARCFGSLFKKEALNTQLTIIPIPPSKTKAHPDYDDRMLQIAKVMVAGTQTPDVKELIEATGDMVATHNEERKPSPAELQACYRLVIPVGYEPRPIILLLDDVLTTGSHFKACQSMLLHAFPNVRVIGIFVARRVFPPVDSEFAF